MNLLALDDPNVRTVLVGMVLLMASAAAVGCFTQLRGRALLGDAVAHAVLPGVCLAYLLVDVKHPLVLLAGASLTGWLSAWAVDYIPRHSRIKPDAAIGLVLSVFFGVGILLLTFIQKSGSGAQSGLDKFLFGKAAALTQADLYVFGLLALVLVLSVWLFFKELALLCFDAAYGRSIGYPMQRIEGLLTLLSIFAIVVGIQAVGVVLMAAMLITPGVAARYWTQRLPVLLWLAVGLAVLSGIVGAYISYALPNMPTGPWVVVVMSALAVLSLLLAPQRGLLGRWLRQRRNQRTMAQENVLKAMYQLGEAGSNWQQPTTLTALAQKRHMPKAALLHTLHKLHSMGMVADTGNGQWQLTANGLARGQRLTKLHRLWELYLTSTLRLAPDHVHDDAETIEHLITPELEAQLERLLNYPASDPHQQRIPYTT